MMDNYSSELVPAASATAPQYMHFVENYINEHCEEPITLSQLVEMSGVSGRTLWEGFKRHKGISPIKYLKSVRMDRVYSDLKNADPKQKNVTDIALARGFTHLGRFSGDYKLCFGESPSETLKKQR